MGDISHSFGQDIDLSASGDFLYVEDETQQHVIKRLLTAANADLWDQTYGAGLGQFVGQPLNLTAITNVIRSQIYKETSVAQLPEPIITASQQGTAITVNISYADATTGQTQTLTIPLGH
jgi:hypothetical protein